MDDRLIKGQNVSTVSNLRRDILETAIKGQEKATSAQIELEYQGEKLKRSLGDAKLIAERAKTTGQAVDELISVRKASKTRRILLCCRDTWCCCRCCNCCNRCYKHTDNDRDQERAVVRENAIELSRLNTLRDREDSDTDTVVKLDSLKNALGNARKTTGSEIPNWRKTLAPPPGASCNGNELWYRQIDASLTHLQQVAEDMGQSLDEQVKMAQMLTIYLNYGVDQVLAANENLNVEKNLF